MNDKSSSISVIRPECMQFQENIILNESQSSTLYSEKIFLTWKACKNFLNEWVKDKDFKL
ncbi:9596_t:CDS:2 [Funneliformis caledonium]|uniref:9596_t:CDS:1 n=1 Tax=Funneliformis caledonium TaxID=1117310 RepID=A0A9N9HNL1_9GLOM|nr:9596_t:CDS:2 [Funneliformis caledonium]